MKLCNNTYNCTKEQCKHWDRYKGTGDVTGEAASRLEAIAKQCDRLYEERVRKYTT